MNSSFRRIVVVGLVLGLGILLLPADTALAADPPRGFTAIFNGTDFSGWKVPEGDGGHWKILDGVIDYDAQSEAEGDKTEGNEKRRKWTERDGNGTKWQRNGNGTATERQRNYGTERKGRTRWYGNGSGLAAHEDARPDC